ncbi:tripartite tricarboxylate transporter permease [Escherichia coli]|nr:tripartite tricarboxylate transporter permease [Escherichia coli]
MIAVGASSICCSGDIHKRTFALYGACLLRRLMLLIQMNWSNKEGESRIGTWAGEFPVIGGVIGSLILMLAAPVLAKFALNFSSYEYMAFSFRLNATLVVGNQPLKAW